MSKTGGGRGTNQHAVQGVSQANQQSTDVLNGLAAGDERGAQNATNRTHLIGDELKARQDEIAAGALEDFRTKYQGRTIRAWDVVCSNGSDVDHLGEMVVLKIADDTDSVDRWTDDDHMDPWFYVSLVDGNIEPGWHVVAVYGPTYHIDGTVEPPTGWEVVEPAGEPGR